MLRGFLVENQACCYCTMRADQMAERQGVEPWTPMKVRLFSKQRPRPTGRAPLMNGLPDVDSHHDEPLNRRPCYFHIIGDLVLPAGIAPAWFRLEDGCLWSARPRERNGRAPRCCPEYLLVPSEAGCCLPRARTRCVVLKWRPVRALLPRPSARQAAALRS